MQMALEEVARVVQRIGSSCSNTACIDDGWAAAQLAAAQVSLHGSLQPCEAEELPHWYVQLPVSNWNAGAAGHTNGCGARKGQLPSTVSTALPHKQQRASQAAAAMVLHAPPSPFWPAAAMSSLPAAPAAKPLEPRVSDLLAALDDGSSCGPCLHSFTSQPATGSSAEADVCIGFGTAAHEPYHDRPSTGYGMQQMDAACAGSAPAHATTGMEWGTEEACGVQPLASRDTPYMWQCGTRAAGAGPKLSRASQLSHSMQASQQERPMSDAMLDENGLPRKRRREGWIHLASNILTSETTGPRLSLDGAGISTQSHPTQTQTHVSGASTQLGWGGPGVSASGGGLSRPGSMESAAVGPGSSTLPATAGHAIVCSSTAPVVPGAGGFPALVWLETAPQPTSPGGTQPTPPSTLQLQRTASSFSSNPAHGCTANDSPAAACTAVGTSRAEQQCNHHLQQHCLAEPSDPMWHAHVHASQVRQLLCTR